MRTRQAPSAGGGTRVRGIIHSHCVSVLVQPLDESESKFEAGNTDEGRNLSTRTIGRNAELPVREFDGVFSVSLPPFLKMKLFRAGFTPPSVSASISIRSGPDRSAYGRVLW